MKSPIDFALLWDETDGYAVHCSSQFEAETFIEWARELFPKMCEQWAPGETNYHHHEGNTIYTFDARMNGKWSKLKLMYGDVTSAADMGYKVIEFADIHKEDDIDESEASLDVLFG